MSDVKAIFNSGVHYRDLINNLEDAIKWEDHMVSDYSKECVQNDEEVARQVHSPIHLMEDNPGMLNNLAFEDMIHKGLSINRLKYAKSKDDLHERGRIKAANDRKGSSTRKPKPNRKYVGLAFAKVGDIRSKLEDSQRCFAIYDTATSSCPSHADLYCILPACPTEMVKTMQARKLQAIFCTIENNPNPDTD